MMDNKILSPSVRRGEKEPPEPGQTGIIILGTRSMIWWHRGSYLTQRVTCHPAQGVLAKAS